MKTSPKTNLTRPKSLYQRGNSGVEIIIIVAIVIVLGALIYSANRPSYVANSGGVGSTYGLMALANVPNFNSTQYASGYVAPVNTLNILTTLPTSHLHLLHTLTDILSHTVIATTATLLLTLLILTIIIIIIDQRTIRRP